jgi:hypothetical protein
MWNPLCGSIDVLKELCSESSRIKSLHELRLDVGKRKLLQGWENDSCKSVPLWWGLELCSESSRIKSLHELRLDVGKRKLLQGWENDSCKSVPLWWGLELCSESSRIKSLHELKHELDVGKKKLLQGWENDSCKSASLWRAWKSWEIITDIAESCVRFDSLNLKFEYIIVLKWAWVLECQIIRIHDGLTSVSITSQ